MLIEFIFKKILQIIRIVLLEVLKFLSGIFFIVVGIVTHYPKLFYSALITLLLSFLTVKHCWFGLIIKCSNTTFNNTIESNASNINKQFNKYIENHPKLKNNDKVKK